MYMPMYVYGVVQENEGEWCAWGARVNFNLLGKTGVGKYYVGGVTAQCGKELLTS